MYIKGPLGIQEVIRMYRYAAREASWRRVFDPYAPLLFNLYHYLEQNLHFGLVPENQFRVSPGRY